MYIKSYQILTNITNGIFYNIKNTKNGCIKRSLSKIHGFVYRFVKSHFTKTSRGVTNNFKTVKITIQHVNVQVEKRT